MHSTTTTAILYNNAKNGQTHTRLKALFPGLPRWAGTRKVKPTWTLLKHERVSGCGISWAICKQSAPHSRQITTATPHLSIFTGRMLFLTVSKHHRSQNEQKGKYIGQQLGNCCWNWSDPVTCFLVSQSKRFQLQSIMHKNKHIMQYETNYYWQCSHSMTHAGSM